MLVAIRDGKVGNHLICYSITSMISSRRRRTVPYRKTGRWNEVPLERYISLGLAGSEHHARDQLHTKRLLPDESEYGFSWLLSRLFNDARMEIAEVANSGDRCL
jgi:hypothetical protein